MKLLFDFFPILLFFISFKLYGIFAATAMAILASLTQVLVYWFKKHKIETMHIVTLLLIVGLGGLTLLLQNEFYIKLKPTAVYWAFSLVFLGSQFVGKRPLIQSMMGENFSLEPAIWRRLNISWVIFFLIMGCLNLVVMYHFDTNTWVNFKLFGGIGMTLLFVIIQAVFLSRHVSLETDKA